MWPFPFVLLPLAVEEVNHECINELALDKGSGEAWRKHLIDPQSLPSRHDRVRWSRFI